MHEIDGHGPTLGAITGALFERAAKVEGSLLRTTDDRDLKALEIEAKKARVAQEVEARLDAEKGLERLREVYAELAAAADEAIRWNETAGFKTVPAHSKVGLSLAKMKDIRTRHTMPLPVQPAGNER